MSADYLILWKTLRAPWSHAIERQDCFPFHESRPHRVCHLKCNCSALPTSRSKTRHSRVFGRKNKVCGKHFQKKPLAIQKIKVFLHYHSHIVHNSKLNLIT